ncbi:hypothetical protein GCM10025883_24200 [Mobilicoccus caccae]|uniref:Secreted protein n=1 Tax=Mobilicoccus caccae TaxID=1859295 RepID=A0ABQ6IR23_9MICO|nr:hypothetical protein GCM10025883_24200 [Mobilicoccus caccae]
MVVITTISLPSVMSSALTRGGSRLASPLGAAGGADQETFSPAIVLLVPEWPTLILRERDSSATGMVSVRTPSA